MHPKFIKLNFYQIFIQTTSMLTFSINLNFILHLYLTTGSVVNSDSKAIVSWRVWEENWWTESQIRGEIKYWAPTSNLQLCMIDDKPDDIDTTGNVKDFSKAHMRNCRRFCDNELSCCIVVDLCDNSIS